MSQFKLRTLCCALATAFAVVGLAGCVGKDAGSYLASANSYIAKSDYKAAIIEIKNALQEAPDNGQARLLLAKSLLATGDAVSAETEVRKAIELHLSDDDTYPLLARTLLAQRKFKNVISEARTSKLATPDARADLDVSLATAYLALGDAKSASSSLEASLAGRPGNVRALLLKAQLAAQGGDLPEARKYLGQALATAPDDVEVLVSGAQIELASGNTGEAQKLLQHAIDVHPGSLSPRFALASLAMRSGKLDIAKAQVAKMKEVSPADNRTLYSEALLAYAENDNARARDDIQKVLAGNPDHLPSLLLWGLVNIRLGSNAAAEEALRKVAAEAPEDSSVARVLAALYLRTGRASQALQALEPALRRTPDDPVLLRTAGEAYLSAGNPTAAASSYERANALDKTNVNSKVRLAQVRLAAGETARGFDDLESLATHDSTQVQADLALITEHLRRREYDKALAAVDALEKKQPKAALVPFLRGTVLLAMRDLKNARVNFDKALQLQPDFYAAGHSLAVIDMQEGQPRLARERYDRMLAKDPDNEQLLLASAELVAITGGSAEQVKEVLDKSIAANPKSARSRLALITYDARHNDGKAAVAAAEAALAAIPNDPQLTEALAAAQLAGGDANQAVETFKRLVEMQPQNALALLRLAEAQAMLKDYAAAIVSERKALALNPDLTPAYVALAKTYLMSGQPEQAIAEAHKLQKERPGKAIGYAFEGEILAAQKKWPEAAAALKTALSREPDSILATRTYALLQAAGGTAEATTIASKWMREHPKDTTMPLFLAQQALQRKDLGSAKSRYEEVLRIDPDNAVALNNLAWMLTEDKDPKGLEYAEHAHRLAPFSPNVLDTLGWALTRNGQAKRGAELLRMASTLAPAQPQIRLHFAKALIESGDKAGARRELTELSKLDKASPVRIEADKLLAGP